MNVLSDIQRELSTSYKALGIPAQTTKSGQSHPLNPNHFKVPSVVQKSAAFRIHRLPIKALDRGDAEHCSPLTKPLRKQTSGLAKSPQSTFKRVSTKVFRCFPDLLSAVCLICIGVGFILDWARHCSNKTTTKNGRSCKNTPKAWTDLLKDCPKKTPSADTNKVIDESAFDSRSSFHRRV